VATLASATSTCFWSSIRIALRTSRCAAARP
jgi:hypothetical protein